MLTRNAAGELYYVDLTPPLLIAAAAQPSNLLQSCSFSLCFDRETQIYELMCNLLKSHLRQKDQQNLRSAADKLLNDALSYFAIKDVRCHAGDADTILGGHNRASQRFCVLYRYLQNEINAEMFSTLYKSYSLKAIARNSLSDRLNFFK